MSSHHELVVSFAVHDAGGWSDDLPELIGAVRAACAAWELQPLARSDAVGAVILAARVRRLREMADDLEEAHAEAVTEVQQLWKQERRDRRREEREREHG